MAVRIREPSWLGNTIEAPGEDVRCSPQEDSAFDVPRIENMQTQTPGGFGPVDIIIPRPEGQEGRYAADRVRRWQYAPVRIFDEANRNVHESRVVKPRAGASEITLECEGFSKHLEDRKDARFIGVDADLSHWGEPSTQRRLNLNALGISSNDVSQETGFLDVGVAVPSLNFNFQTFQSGVQRAGEMWYYGGGTDLGKLRYDFSGHAGAPLTNWVDQAYLTDDDLGTAATPGTNRDPGTDHDAVSAGNQTVEASVAGRKYAALQSRYAGAFSGETVLSHSWHVIVLGNHGLQERGTGPDIGFYASDFAPYIVGRWAPLLRLTSRSIEQFSFVIPHYVFLEDTKPSEMIEALALFGGNSFLPLDWGAYDKREFFLASPGNYGRPWRTRLDEAAEPEDAGDDASERLTGVKVSYDDGTGGGKLSVGPPGSEARIETTALLDTRPDNPVNMAKGAQDKYDSYSMEVTSEAGAILIGQTILYEANRKRWSGDIAFKGTVRDLGSNEEPVYMMRAGDRGVIEDDPDTAERRITATSYDSATRTLRATIGQPPGRLEALLTRIGVRLTGKL